MNQNRMTNDMPPEVTVPDIRKKTLKLLLQIPKGKVTTYQILAQYLGDKIASRAVGQIMAQNPWPDKYPCYKVVHSDGSVGKYSAPGGGAEKIRKLRQDGVEIAKNRINNLPQYLFGDFESDEPLKRLRTIQHKIVNRASFDSDPVEYQTVGGVDVSYGKKRRAVAAYTLFDLRNKKLLYQRVKESEVVFPYIPTYLAFRELPIMSGLLTEVKGDHKMADVVMVDGNGMLHPRHAGIASHLGVILNISTIGVAKKLLCGEGDLEDIASREVRYIWLEGEKIGAAVKTTERAKPIYVSPGHRCNLNSVIKITLKVSDYKIPEPIRAAHRIGREAVKLGKRKEEKGDQRTLDL